MVAHDFIEESVTIPCGDRSLEGILAYPERDSPRQGVLLLSPHPHMGGRMDNNVIEHLARRLAEAGSVTLRFNYGGVGGSSLELPEDVTTFDYWGRIEAEQDYRAVLPDVIAARDFLVQALPPRTPVVYLGYSFGSCMATLLTGVSAPHALIAISPPVSRVRFENLDACTMPVCFVTGDQDFVFDPERFRETRDAVPGPITHVHLNGCDHFFRKEEGRVYDVLRAFLKENILFGAPL